jgi:hypothetical protein
MRKKIIDFKFTKLTENLIIDFNSSNWPFVLIKLIDVNLGIIYRKKM